MSQNRKIEPWHMLGSDVGHGQFRYGSPLDVGWIPSFTNWHPTYETDLLPGLPAVALAVSGQNGGLGGGNAVTNRVERGQARTARPEAKGQVIH